MPIREVCALSCADLPQRIPTLFSPLGQGLPESVKGQTLLPMASPGLRPIRTNSRYQSFGALQGDLDSKRADMAKLKTQIMLEQYTASEEDWQRPSDNGSKLLSR